MLLCKLDSHGVLLEISFTSFQVLLDARQYYLPQTRNRGYLIMVDHDTAGGEKEAMEISSDGQRSQEVSTAGKVVSKRLLSMSRTTPE